MAIVSTMTKIVIHHVAGPDIHRKALRYLDEKTARACFNALRECWIPQPNDYHYELVDANGVTLDQFDARKVAK